MKKILSIHADDTTVILSDSDSGCGPFILLDIFKELSGLALICSKTEGIWIGSSRGKYLKTRFWH